MGFSAGIWTTALPVEFYRSLLDEATCELFSEVIITGSNPYVLGVLVTVSGSEISGIEALVTDEDDWLFNADDYLRYSRDQEDWSVVPADQRSTRDELIAAGQAYFDYFSDKNVQVPWGTPCARLEGGAYTGDASCNVGVPSGVQFAPPHWVADLELQTAVGVTRMGGAGGLPDSHMFRVIDGKLRYIHTLTVCTVPNCGM